MKAERHFIPGMKCCVCGVEMTPPHNDKSSSFTLDHIYPKSYGAEYTRYQPMCKRCNGLKGNHIPTVQLIRILCAVRASEEKTGEICKCITCNLLDDCGLHRSYTLSFKDIGSIDLEITFGVKCKMEPSNSVDAEKRLKRMKGFITRRLKT